MKRKSGSDDQLYFLKVLRDQESEVARKRMYIEVSQYKSIDHASIPKLIESNAKLYQDKSYKLYLVTEYIQGSNLAKKQPASARDAKKFILKICNIMSYCHQNNIIHRNIKPENIILRNNQWDDPVLVDFGMSSCINEQVNSYHQEIGNRFLRLPEFAPNGELKCDKRSDITHSAGIFFYVLTGIKPAILIDEQGNMPHQRKIERKKLEESFQTFL